MTINDLAIVLSAARQEKEMSRYRVSKLSGLNLHTVTTIEKGNIGYNVAALLAYARAVGLNIKFEENV